MMVAAVVVLAPFSVASLPARGVMLVPIATSFSLRTGAASLLAVLWWDLVFPRRTSLASLLGLSFCAPPGVGEILLQIPDSGAARARRLSH